MQVLLRSRRDTTAYLQQVAASALTGEAAFHSGDSAAKAYFLSGRILWAFASGQTESFQSILLRDNILSRDALMNGVKQARALNKRNLEEILLLLGVKDRELRASIIHRHTCAAIAAILQWRDLSVEFVPKEFSAELSSFPLESVFPAAGTGDEHETPPEQRLPFEEAPLLADIPEVLERLRSEISFFLAVVVVDGETGMPIASIIDAEQLDVDAASAFCKQIAAACAQSLHSLNQKPQALEEITMTTAENYVLVRTVNNGAYFLYLLLDGRGNVGMARLVLKRYLPLLAGFLS